MANVKKGRMFSAEFNKATEVNSQTRLLAQTPNEPVEYVDLEQVAEVVNEGMLSEQEAADTYATKTGEYKELTAGFAYEVLGDGQATAEKFSFRPTGGPNRNVRDGSARIEVLKGNSVGWNQLVDADTTSVTLTANHKYITNIGGTISLQSPTSATTINVEGGVDKVTDITQMFGAGNEPTTVEKFYELLPEGVDINAYKEGEIVDANYKAIKSTAFNQWDEQWEVGGFNTETGNPTNTDTIRSVNYIKVIPTQKYFTHFPYITNVVMFIVYYDRNKKVLKVKSNGRNTQFTTPENCFYIKFYMQQSYGTTYNNDICINIAWDEYSALNGKYKPYKPFERDLSWVAKYFPNGMRSAGNVADEIRFNGTTQQWEAVQRIGVVDLGSLTWQYNNTSGSLRFYTQPQSYIAQVASTVVANLTSIYATTTWNKLFVNTADKTIALNPGGNIGIYDTAYTDVATFKAAMAGVMLNYELAEPIVTPITEDVNLAYDVADYGTEQLIVADGAQSAPLSAEIVYENNASMLLKQIAPALDRLDAIEAILATRQAAVSTTNEE